MIQVLRKLSTYCLCTASLAGQFSIVVARVCDSYHLIVLVNQI